MREQDEAHCGKTDSFELAAIEQMDQHRQRRREKSEQEKRIEKKNRHGAR